MRIFRHLLLSVLLLLNGVLIFLPCFPAALAGLFIYVSLCAWPLLIIDICCLLCLWKEKSWRFAIVIMLFGSGVWVLNYLPSAHRHPKNKEGENITVVSWNVDNLGTGYQNYQVLPQSARAIVTYHPDIICLQERPHTNVISWDSIQACFSDYPYKLINTREDEVLNLVVFSKYPLRNLKEYYYPGSYNKMMQVDVQVNKAPIRLFNVHLQTTNLSADFQFMNENKLCMMQDNAILRNQQADELHQAIEDSPYPVLVCGDFNDTRASYAYRTVAKGLRDGHREAGAGWGGSYKKLFKIDYILSSAANAITDYQLIDVGTSDHEMQVARMIIDSK